MDSWVAASLACVLGLGLGAWCALRLRAAREQNLARARGQRARRGELRAAQLLEASGFRIEGRHVRRTYAITVDGAARDVSLILDYVVSRDGESWVAEVKTGAGPTSVQHAETRRQLLEYQLATGAERVLLVDPEASVIREVAFPIPRAAPPVAERPAKASWPLAVGVVIGLCAIAWLLVRSC